MSNEYHSGDDKIALEWVSEWSGVSENEKTNTNTNLCTLWIDELVMDSWNQANILINSMDF